MKIATALIVGVAPPSAAHLLYPSPPIRARVRVKGKVSSTLCLEKPVMVAKCSVS